MSGTVPVAAALMVLAALDGMFAGFRASCGRDGMVRHRRTDIVAARCGLTVGALLLAPVAAFVLVDIGLHPARLAGYRTAGQAMLWVYLPYGLPVLVALVAYVTLRWRHRFIASALLLGPLTLVRPLIALLGAVVAWWAARDLVVGAAAFAAVAAVLLVELLVGRRFVPMIAI